jgi:hypothetical protein
MYNLNLKQVTEKDTNHDEYKDFSFIKSAMKPEHKEEQIDERESKKSADESENSDWNDSESDFSGEEMSEENTDLIGSKKRKKTNVKKTKPTFLSKIYKENPLFEPFSSHYKTLNGSECRTCSLW